MQQGIESKQNPSNSALLGDRVFVNMKHDSFNENLECASFLIISRMKSIPR